MARMGATPFALPDFTGATRRLVLVNLVSFFVLLLAQLADKSLYAWISIHCVMVPQAFLDGWLWQPLTYSLVHLTLVGTLFELLSLWFLASFLEAGRGSTWVTGLYAVSVLGTALAAVALYVVGDKMGFPIEQIPLYGCMGGIFGMLIAVGMLFGDVQFLLFFTIAVKARYMAAIYALITFAMLFGQNRLAAFAQLGGAVAGILYIRLSPRRGFAFQVSERMYGVRNAWYRWKRRRAARKFEVYMRKQGRTVRLDSRGRQIDEDPDDKSRWN